MALPFVEGGVVAVLQALLLGQARDALCAVVDGFLVAVVRGDQGLLARCGGAGLGQVVANPHAREQYRDDDRELHAQARCDVARDHCVASLGAAGGGGAVGCMGTGAECCARKAMAWLLYMRSTAFSAGSANATTA